ncbi:hypothetical protein [Dehalobacter sp.]|uniref:hypothetical protein n=1 Tax=Dehalobacter sp. TaxID=1962289 RepID=UPI0002F07364|nr:hypothetical protein [Dehalobacter sp.]MCG1025404.1 hypothetical protein [Dehalobacter sp.]
MINHGGKRAHRYAERTLDQIATEIITIKEQKNGFHDSERARLHHYVAAAP